MPWYLASHRWTLVTPPRVAAAIKIRRDILDAFEDTGVALPPDKRARMSAILERLEAIRQEFGRNIRNNKTRVSFTADEVKGLPQSYLDRAQRDDKGNYLLGFESPEYLPFMANAENEDARAGISSPTPLGARREISSSCPKSCACG
jgi:thimet oligopeptidase